MMPNKTYEIRKLYFQQNPYPPKQAKPSYPPLLQWPEKGYFGKFKHDTDLLQKAFSPIKKSAMYSIADQVFGNQKDLEYLGLKHETNLIYERAQLHNQHIQEIDRRHIEAQEKKFGVEINNFPDKSKRLSNLENQLLQLDGQRREEELAFWKDTVELRGKLFEGASDYRAVKHRYTVFSDVEADYGK